MGMISACADVRASSLKGIMVVSLGAIVFSALMLRIVGFIFPGGDLMLILPRLAQLNGSASLDRDLFFSVATPNYKFISGIFFLLSRIASFPVCTIFLFFLSYAILAIALWIALRDYLLNKWLIGLLVVFPALTGFDFIWVKLTHPMYHPQFTAYAFMFLAIVLLVKENVIGVVLSIAISTFFHPLVGLWGICLTGMGCLITDQAITKRIMLLIGLFLVFVVLIQGSIIGSLAQIDEHTLKEYINLILYVRAPHHHNPSYWDFSTITNFVVLVLYSLGLSIRYRGILAFVLIFSLLLTCLGIINNEFFQIPTLVLSWPMRMSITIVFVVWIFIARHLIDLIRAKYYFLAAALLCSQNIIGLTSVGIVAMIVEWYRNRLPIDLLRRDVFWADLMAILFLFSFELVLSITRYSFWAPRIYLWAGLIIPVIIVARHLRKPDLVKCILVSTFVGFIVTRIVLASDGQIKINPDSDPAWRDMCSVVKQQVPQSACVVIPPEKEDFQYLSNRSVYVSEKHFPFRPEDAIEWGRRLNRLGILPVNISKIEKTDVIIKLEYSSYDRISADILREIVRVNPCAMYCIVRRSVDLPFPSIHENAGYRMYKISEDGSRKFSKL